MSAMSDMVAETRLLDAGAATLPRVNLLPPEIAEAARFRKIQAALAGVLVLAVAGVGMTYMSAQSSVSSAEEQVATATAQRATLNSQIAEFADVKTVYQRAADAQALLTAAMGQEVRYSRFLNDLSLSIPDNVWLTDATFDQAAVTAAAATPAATGARVRSAAPVVPATLGSVTMSGFAFAHNDVATWLESLATQKGYGNPYLTSSTETLIGEREAVEWTTTVVITPSALSGRFTDQAGS